MLSAASHDGLEMRCVAAGRSRQEARRAHLVDRPKVLVVLPSADLHPVHEQELPGQQPAQVHLARAALCY